MMRTPPILLLALLFAICATGAKAQNFYGPGIQDVKVLIPVPDWDYKLDSLKKNNPDARIECSVTLNKIRYEGAGIRYKGNSSYFRSRNETYKKLPFNIKLNLKDRDQKMKSGHTAVKLSNGFMDPSFIRDPLSYEIIRQYMPAPVCNFARLTINDKFFGLYINTESIDEQFIRTHFDTNNGYLVKCDPDNWKKVRSQSGCPKGENASLSYLNESAGCYDAFYEVDDPGAWGPLLKLIKTLNKNPEEIESVLDVDQALWMLALNNILVNLDSYNGALSHNYYLWFDTTGVAHPLIWDLNMSFGGWRRNFSFVEMPDNELIQMQPLTEIANPRRPLISQLLKNPYYRKIYLAHYRTILKNDLESGKLLQRAEAIIKEIEPVVQEDSLKLYSLEAFQNSLDQTLRTGPDNVIGIRQLMEARTTWLLRHPLMLREQPVISDAKHLKKGTQHLITANISNGAKARLYFRNHKSFAFRHVPMYDDGTNGDLNAGDGIFSALVDTAAAKHYYIAAENDNTAATLPERASYEYFEIR